MYLDGSGNHLYAADALRAMGDRRGAKGDIAGARELYQRALALLAPLGEHEKTGVVLNNMAIGYENQGQIGESEKLYRQAAQTWTECGDLLHAGVALSNLADILMLRGQLHQAENQYERGRRQIEAIDPAGVAYDLYSIAALRLYEGDLVGARHYTDQAMAIARKVKNVNDIAADSQIIGSIQVAADDLAGARQSFEQARSILQQKESNSGVAEAEAALAGVSLEEGKLSEAEQQLRKSLVEFRSENAMFDEISAETDLARTLLHEGRLADARHTISDAGAHSTSSTDPALQLPVEIIDALIQAAELSARANAKSTSDVSAPQRKLESALASAHRLGYFGIECDARLAMAELELRGNPAGARTHLAELASEARRHGMNLVARKAATLASSATPVLKPRA